MAKRCQRIWSWRRTAPGHANVIIQADTPVVDRSAPVKHWQTFRLFQQVLLTFEQPARVQPACCPLHVKECPILLMHSYMHYCDREACIMHSKMRLFAGSAAIASLHFQSARTYTERGMDWVKQITASRSVSGWFGFVCACLKCEACVIVQALVLLDTRLWDKDAFQSLTIE